MMLLSRFWYVVLGLVAAAALYVAYLAVGQYNRRNTVAMNELIASDSQTVGWALQIDARRRLDAMLVGAVDKGVQDSLNAANGRDAVPAGARASAKKALGQVTEKIPAEFRSDALFAVDRDGRVVGQVGYDAANAFDDFELGGYAAVNDALHGYLRDDTWVLGGRIYRVVARPVEYELGQAPVGAIVGIRLVDGRFASDIAKRTRANVAFYSAGQRVASASGSEGFEDTLFEAVTSDLPKLDGDKSYKDSGRSDVKLVGENAGAMFARFVGESWDLGAGYAVIRTRAAIASPMGFLSGADDKDKASVPIGLLALLTLVGVGVGIGLSFIEHTLPLKLMASQADDLKSGKFDLLQLARFRGGYRAIAADLNSGIERVAEKGGGSPRKAADLEQILGPTPAQPAMSAFAFPPPEGSAPGASPSGGQVGSHAGPAPSSPGRALGSSGSGPAVQRPPTGGAMAPHAAPIMTPAGPMTAISGGVPAISGSGARASAPQMAPPAPGPKPPPPKAPVAPPPPAPMHQAGGEDEDDEATMVAAIPKEVLAAATGEHRAQQSQEEGAEWLSVYEDFLRTKRQCGEATDGLTFEKFQHTLRKNRDALIQRHGCKRVKFSVYVKEGKASLKATPVKD